MCTKELVYVINNQLTIVMGRAELLACSAEDPRIRSRCQEIGDAVQKISLLLNRLPVEKT